MRTTHGREGSIPRQRFRSIAAGIAGVLALIAVSVVPSPVHAIEQSTSSSVSSSTSASMTFRGGMTATATVTQGTTQYGADGVQLLSTTPHSAYGAASSMFSPELNPASIPTIGVEAYAGMCGGVNYTGFCGGNGTLTLTFSQPVSNPIIDVSGLGGWAYCVESTPNARNCDVIEDNGITMATNADGDRTAASWMSQQLTIVTPGVTFSSPSGQNIATTPTTLTAATVTSSHRCDTIAPTAADTAPYTMGSTALAGCGSVTLNGTFQSVTFDIGTNIQRAPASAGWANGYNVANTGSPMADLIRMSVRLQSDLGDAPTSYDASTAANHIAGPLRLGSSFTTDAPNVINPTTSPNASTSASLDTDDAINDGERAPDAVIGATYSQEIPLTGTVAAGTLAGWIDFNKNGVFDTGERTSTTFAAGATSATLTWSVPTTATVGDTYLRLRTSFTASEVTSPRGVARSGEVEDYIIGLAAPSPEITVIKLVNGQDANTAPGVSVASGSTLSFQFQVQNTGNIRLTGVTLTDDVIPGANITPPPGWTGALNPGQSVTFTATYPAPVDGGVLHTNTATVSGNPVTGGPPVTDTDPANATTEAEPAITVVKLVNGEDANTAPGVTVAAGSTLSFEFEVTNTGNVQLDDVTLTDDVIPGASLVPPPGWTGTLSPGESATFTATYPAPADGGVLHTNTATVTGTPATGGPDVTDSDPANATTEADPAITVIKLVNGEDANSAPGVMVAPGSTLSFEFEVTNTGNVQLDDVTVTDDVIAGADITPPTGWTGTLAPGESATFTATYPAPAGGDELHTNTATVSGTPMTGGPDVTDDDPANATTFPLVDIFIEKLGESTSGTWVPMDGAQFALLTDVSGSPGVPLTSPTVQPVSGVVGQFTVEGLLPGTYWLEETASPDGFSLLAHPVRFSVDDAGVVQILDTTSPQVTASADTITVRDVPVFELPQAGGPGTSGFFVGGSLLLLAAAVGGMLVRRRRTPLVLERLR